jgi:hypothetical protein
MSPQEAVVAEYNKTILDLQTRIAALAQFAAEQQIKAAELEKQLKAPLSE